MKNQQKQNGVGTFCFYNYTVLLRRIVSDYISNRKRHSLCRKELIYQTNVMHKLNVFM